MTAAVDGLQFLHSIKVGDLIILSAHVTATFRTSMEVEVRVMSEQTLTGRRTLTSHAYLTFVAIVPTVSASKCHPGAGIGSGTSARGGSACDVTPASPRRAHLAELEAQLAGG